MIFNCIFGSLLLAACHKNYEIYEKCQTSLFTQRQLEMIILGMNTFLNFKAG